MVWQVSGRDTDLLPILAGDQALASKPDSHVWLAASAGTGKTQVLAARVFRLLLRGTDPEAILCLTFTKAGSAEMAGRIGARLASWVRMPLADLKKDLFALGEKHLDPKIIERARTLFAKVLDAPGGGIRIETIHGFCQSLLAAFPVEAGLVPGFRPIEAREEALLARETLSQMLVDAEREGRGSADAVAALSLRLGEGGAEAFLLACARAPDAMAALPSGIAPFMRRVLDLPGGDMANWIAHACDDRSFDVGAVRRLMLAYRAWGTKTGTSRADAMERWIFSDASARGVALPDLRATLHAKDGMPFAVGKKLTELEPDFERLQLELGVRCAELLGIVARGAYADLLARALGVGRDYAAAYQRAKRRIGAVDFDDLIRATVALLAQPGMGEWVRYKLDQVTEHILVDEAQDTNLRQWAIVRALAAEFFAGAGVHGDKPRTLFVVGDFKQAIFGFQGTNPLYFAAAERDFRRLADDALDPQTGQGTPFKRLSLTQSFRSTAPVLEFVDAAVAAIGDRGLGIGEDMALHASKVPGPGTIMLWPLHAGSNASEDTDDEESWIDDETRALAGQIARTIAGWLDPASPLILESKGRALRPEDVMILVKRRGDLASLIVARLYAEKVPVAGVDRLRLNAPLAVRDLLAAIRFALQPDDDLSLASLLVSPLIGWTQEQLMDAAVERGRASLWRHLRATQGEERLAPLRALLASADLVTPYRLLEQILSGEMDGRRKLVARMGEEVRDPVEELLGAALQFESLATPSLQAFLDWFDRGEVEIVRDPSAPLDAVRVMTVHGAKGLQAPLVILADATLDPVNAPRSILSWAPEELGEAFPIFRPRASERGGPLDTLVAEAAERDLQEHWRLFYVAATRAEERLVIAGALGPRAKGVPPPNSWYALADRAMAGLGVPADEGGGRRFTGSTVHRPVTRTAGAKDAGRPILPPPAWLRAPAPQEARPPRPLAPSSIGNDDLADAPPSPAMRRAAERGRLIHALFERLPGVDPALRQAAALRWLASQGADDALAADVIVSVSCVIDDRRFAQLFAANALAEAPITAVLADGTVIAGTVDRLLIEDGVVRLVDFKTGRRAPGTLDEVPAAHLRQMAAYSSALSVIFPGHRIEPLLLYTATPIVFSLPEEVLNRHKSGFSRGEQSLGQDRL